MLLNVIGTRFLPFLPFLTSAMSSTRQRGVDPCITTQHDVLLGEWGSADGPWRGDSGMITGAVR